jgi:hypothetical protein
MDQSNRYADLSLREEDLIKGGRHILVAYKMKPKAGYDYLQAAAHFAAESSTGTNVEVCTTDEFTFPLVCPRCGGEMRIIAFITDACAVREILSHLGEPTSPPPIAPARGPPLWEITDAEQGEFDPPAQPAPDYAGVRIRSAHRLVKAARRRSDRSGSSGTACTMGRGGGLVGHRGDPWPSWPSWCCGSGEVFRLRRHAFPESRLLSGPIRAWNTCGSGVGSPIPTIQSSSSKSVSTSMFAVS